MTSIAYCTLRCPYCVSNDLICKIVARSALPAAVKEMLRGLPIAGRGFLI